jgi:hypothetical protein
MPQARKSSTRDESFAAAAKPACLLLAFSVLAAGWLQFRPLPGNGPLLGVFSPFQGAEAATAAALAAGARLVSASPLPFALVVQSDDPGFRERLSAAGAWLVLDATGRGLCAPFDEIRR